MEGGALRGSARSAIRWAGAAVPRSLAVVQAAMPPQRYSRAMSDDTAASHSSDAAPPPPQDLPAILDHLWSMLDCAVRQRRDGWHLPVLATIDGEGAPAARTVVLRAVDRGARSVFCHSDARSPKVAEIARSPLVAWCFYDASRREQVRLRGRARVHRAADEDSLALDRWQIATPSSRRCYLAPRAPGETAEQASPNLPEELRRRLPEEGEDAAGLVNFAVIATQVEVIDWLELHADGHRWARFVWEGAWVGKWVEP
jgi:pyridoxamine 5'-phosphate oxidase